MDEIWGGGNFIRNIIWHKRYAASNDSKGIPDMHDFIICYQKTNLFQRNLLPRSEKQDNLYKYDSHDGMGLWRSDNLSVKTYSKNYDYPITNPNTGKQYFPPNGRAWMSNEEQILKWIDEWRIFFGKDNLGAPQLKRYLLEVQKGIVPISLWSYEDVNHTDGAKKELKSIFEGDKSPFETPKPVRLIEKILQISTNSNDIILDSFAGSGTTAQAVLNLNKADGGNRKFILVEMEDYAETITAERVKRVINGYGNVAGTGGDFNYYELGESLFDEDRNINENLPVTTLRDYIWYVETKDSLPTETSYLSSKLNSSDLKL
jgi:adenine-specific DNA-methyltransferase